MILDQDVEGFIISVFADQVSGRFGTQTVHSVSDTDTYDHSGTYKIKVICMVAGRI